MNWLDFIAVSEWPALLAAGMALFRRQIGAIVSRLTSGGGQAGQPHLPKVAPLIEEAENLVAERLVCPEIGTHAPGPWQDEIDAAIAGLRDIEDYPADYALLRCWTAVERLARRRTDWLAKDSQHLSLAELSRALDLRDEARVLGRHLRDIRTQVADGAVSISPGDALRYRDLVTILLNDLRAHDASPAA